MSEQKEKNNIIPKIAIMFFFYICPMVYLLKEINNFAWFSHSIGLVIFATLRTHFCKRDLNKAVVLK